jgi:hypothetical protein
MRSANAICTAWWPAWAALAALPAQAPDPAVQPSAHWSFQPVVRPAVPAVASHPIDSFVAVRLAAAGLSASPEADRTMLIRRLWLVMLGVPPTPEEVAAFTADGDARAYERLVDRVLDDPRYGERWARHWLDVVRFAESNGFETNRERVHAWRYRDWVIGAFNQDLPYDQFVREQLAGDALGADVATGFLVGGPVDIVGSPDPALTAQQRADELDDMVATTGSALLGLSVGCARCHNHKFDPIGQREYYALSAVFAGVKHGDRPLREPEQQAELAPLEARIAELEHQLAPYRVEVAAVDAGGVLLRPPVDFAHNEERFAPTDAKFVRFVILATTEAEPCIDDLAVWSGERNVALASAGAHATASGTLSGYAIHQLVHVHDGAVGNAHSWISDEPGGGWVQIEFAQIEPIDRIEWGRDREGVYRDRLATSYRIETSRDGASWQTLASSADRAPFPGATKARAKPTYDFASAPNPAAARALLEDLQQAERQRDRLRQVPLAYAGQFVAPAPTHRLHRGDPMQPREAVAPGSLAIFAPFTLAADAPEQQRRVELARWLTDPAHPLTARVFVNRVWQHHFGVGLVSTPNDFGKNGTRPSHPELLDWLASEFVASGWRVKALHRLILTSATWRQASAPRADALQIDGDSRWLWRFPPRRLEAEAIRDGMLAVSGTLDARAGGPSFFLHDVVRENVYHYTPKATCGPAEARRMVYAFKVRMEQDAVFGAFDCPDGSLVMPRRGTSTTPLQALNLFNSTFTLQQADALAARVRREAGEDLAAAGPRAWQLVYQRAPDAHELAAAIAFAREHGLPALCRALLNSNEFLFVP